ncbi:hypothetical protein RFI36_13020 [Acinetobacter gerneri]|uniref:Uncharacterized protein n=1 Tax=Acinetobacter gerneri TaxID=202952 RepID=A0AAW8JI92_9GAMM|nr:hypothetical protein [Acinetobacter gerneri]MDQ9010527.1 hypothetical protein [Acinetobacter gerneri]MDQ9014726.1 hypothetical protein [Acinetobacter gerneri]MDQ9025936.1 hypothetical protein [Acinetobacter gerneri]MDQ9053178.1 hypothetical protein [Acinetobacter gerneri]MDQ9060835.1 hypothetical protein [Acinetobacter gerneri]
MRLKVKKNAHEQKYSESMHPEIQIGNEYEVIGIDSKYFRIICDDGEPVLYEKEIFDIIDPTIPNNWVKVGGEDEYALSPPELSTKYFFEEYFDGKKNVIQIFEKYVNSMSIK